MSNAETNVIQLKPTKPSREGWGPREQEALMLARLAAMPMFDYERIRLRAAKELKCRVSWLDKTVESIRFKAAAFANFPPAKDGRNEVGTPRNFFRDDGSSVTAFLVASAHKDGQDSRLIVLADGNATAVNSVPLSDEGRAELERCRGAPE
jgi:hypothetical protein